MSVPKPWVHLTLPSADQESMLTLRDGAGHKGLAQRWLQPSSEVSTQHELKRHCARLTPLAPRSSMGEFFWKTLSRPWEVVGTSCVLKLGGQLRGEDGLVGGSGAS